MNVGIDSSSMSELEYEFNLILFIYSIHEEIITLHIWSTFLHDRKEAVRKIKFLFPFCPYITS